MARKRRELTNSEQLKHAAEIEHLRDIGIDIGVNQSIATTPNLDFEIGYGPNFHNIIFKSTPWQIGLVMGARIVARRSDIYLTGDIEVQLPWHGPEFMLWEALDDDEWYFRFDPVGYFEKDQVLNLQLEAGLRLQPGKVLSGFLILVADGVQLPADYADRTPVDVQITLFDSLGTEYSAQGIVGVDRRIEADRNRMDRRREAIRKGTSGKRTLFDVAIHPPTDGIQTQIEEPKKEDPSTGQMGTAPSTGHEGGD